MIAKPIVDRIPVKSDFIILILGAALTGMVVSLGFFFGLALLDFAGRETGMMSAVGAALVGILIMSGWTLYDFCFHRFVHWDLIVIMGAMALSQWIALIFYGRKN